MDINKNIIEDFRGTESSLLVVSKYLNGDETDVLIDKVSGEYDDVVVGFGENRIESLFEKNLEREIVHFIGNIQTKQIKHIVSHCETIHSLDNPKHIRKIEDICSKQDTWVKVFLQINVDPTKDGGISAEKIPEMIALIDECENISLVGFSAIGKIDCEEEEKREEFKLLKTLRSKYIPNGLISAGTSVDYKTAIEEEIEIVRVGKALYN